MWGRRTEQGAPVYLRDAVDVDRGCDSPPRYRNSTTGDANGNWQRSRAITIATRCVRAGTAPIW
jgi:hypothetical protein